MMKACLQLLKMGYLRYKDQSDPVMVSRHMSGLVNANVSASVFLCLLRILRIISLEKFF